MRGLRSWHWAGTPENTGRTLVRDTACSVIDRS